MFPNLLHTGSGSKAKNQELFEKINLAEVESISDELFEKIKQVQEKEAAETKSTENPSGSTEVGKKQEKVVEDTTPFKKSQAKLYKEPTFNSTPTAGEKMLDVKFNIEGADATENASSRLANIIDMANDVLSNTKNPDQAECAKVVIDTCIDLDKQFKKMFSY